MTNAVLPYMRARRQGRIINVGSLAAWVGEPGETFYSASKHALAGYTEALRHEVWPLRIHVSLVEPGPFETSVLDTSTIAASAIADYDAVRQAAHHMLEESLRKGGNPRKVAHLISKTARERSPRLRYGVGCASHWLPFLKVLLPQSLFDSILRKAYGIVKNEAAPRQF